MKRPLFSQKFWQTQTLNQELLESVPLKDWKYLLFKSQIDSIMFEEAILGSSFNQFTKVFYKINTHPKLLFLSSSTFSLNSLPPEKQKVFWHSKFGQIEKPLFFEPNGKIKVGSFLHSTLIPHCFKNKNPLLVFENWFSCLTYFHTQWKDKLPDEFEIQLVLKIRTEELWWKNLIKALLSSPDLKIVSLLYKVAEQSTNIPHEPEIKMIKDLIITIQERASLNSIKNLLTHQEIDTILL